MGLGIRHSKGCFEVDLELYDKQNAQRRMGRRIFMVMMAYGFSKKGERMRSHLQIVLYRREEGNRKRSRKDDIPFRITAVLVA
jgi:hypothetical protein